MHNKPRIYGVMPVLQMPFHEDESIDFDILEKEVNYVIDAGCDGVVIALASELVRLTGNERFELTRRLPGMVNGRGTVTISVGAETAREATLYAEAAEHAGANAVMAVPPVATLLPEYKAYEYYQTIHDAIGVPLVVQDASGYFGHSLSVEIQTRLRTELGDRIYFKPEAQPVGPTLSKLQESLNHQGVIFEGSGGVYLVDAYRRGISGTMPGCDLIRGIVAIWKALKSGDDTRAYEVYFPLSAIVMLQLASLDTYLAIEKYLLVKQGIFNTTLLRQPSGYDLDPFTKTEVDRLYNYLEAALDKRTG